MVNELNRALLPNACGDVTLHECVRLEVREQDGECAIYPIFQCLQTESERIFGCLRPDINPRELEELFPGVVLEELDDDELPDWAVGNDEMAA